MLWFLLFLFFFFCFFVFYPEYLHGKQNDTSEYEEIERKKRRKKRKPSTRAENNEQPKIDNARVILFFSLWMSKTSFLIRFGLIASFLRPCNKMQHCFVWERGRVAAYAFANRKKKKQTKKVLLEKYWKKKFNETAKERGRGRENGNGGSECTSGKYTDISEVRKMDANRIAIVRAYRITSQTI